MIVSKWPYSDAWCKGVFSSKSLEFLSQPDSINILTIFIFPLIDAKCNGVLIIDDLGSLSISTLDNNSLTTSI